MKSDSPARLSERLIKRQFFRGRAHRWRFAASQTGRGCIDLGGTRLILTRFGENTSAAKQAKAVCSSMRRSSPPQHLGEQLEIFF